MKPPIERDSPRAILGTRIIFQYITSDPFACKCRKIIRLALALLTSAVHMIPGFRVGIAIQCNVIVTLLIKHEPRNMLRLEAIFLNDVIVLDARRCVKVIDPNRMVTSIDGNGVLGMCIINVAQDTQIPIAVFESMFSLGIGCVEVICHSARNVAEYEDLVLRFQLGMRLLCSACRLGHFLPG
jgi:hypothetical protein